MMRLGVGPVFRFEWLTTARNWRVYAMRSVFGLGLLAILTLVAMNQSDSRGGRTSLSIQEQAEIGRDLSMAIIATQLTLMILIAPATTAATLCLDKARGTLAHVLTTDLEAFEIILGKLGAKILPALGLILSSMGVMAICTLMGGIDPMWLAGSMLVSLGVTVLGASLALGLSVWASKTHEVVMASYMLIFAYLILYPGWWVLSSAGIGWSRPPDWLGLGHPYWLALDAAPGRVPIHRHAWFALACLGLSSALALLATWRLRAAALKQLNRAARVRKGRLRLWRFLPSPSLDGNPILWREWHRKSPSRWTRFIWMAYAAAAIGSTTLAISTIQRPGMGPRGEVALVLVNGFQVALGFLLLSVSAATSLAEERVRGSLDVLLSTSISTRSIVWGKWWATFRIVPLLAVLPMTLIVAAGIWSKPPFATPAGWIPPPGWGTHAEWAKWLVPPLVFGLILAYGAALTSLGLVMATWISRVDRAVIATVSAYVIVALAWPIAMVILIPNNNVHGPGLASASPFLGVAITGLQVTVQNAPWRYDSWWAQIAWAAFWIVFFVAVAGLLLFLELSRFNRKLGRTPDAGMPARPAPHPAKAKPVPELV